MPRDFRGREIGVGDIVVYPGRQSSHLWMNEGEVVAVTRVVNSYGKAAFVTLRVKVYRRTGWRDTEPRIVTISNISNVVVLEGKNDRS